MTPEKYLKQVSDLDREINSKCEELEKLNAIILKATNFSTLDADSGNQSPIEIRIEKIEQYQLDINQKIDEYVELKNRISNEIDGLDNEVSRVILRERYILGKKWDRISEEQHYSRRHVSRIHDQALMEFREKYIEKF